MKSVPNFSNSVSHFSNSVSHFSNVVPYLSIPLFRSAVLFCFAFRFAFRVLVGAEKRAHFEVCLQENLRSDHSNRRTRISDRSCDA